uniref:CPG4 domain-containing protein n=1 Tax=Caenorhabditis tropicalis TaxID=1561998 RepID=A0A1I7U4B3_9PELO
MLRFSFFIILTTSVVNSQNSCEDRCTRLKQRSLSRIGYDDERLQTLFERQRPLESMKDVCWRLYDNLDCMKKCPKSESHALFDKHVRNKCRFVLSEMNVTLKCISKHHAFLSMRCSSFLNEASRLRAESDLSTTPRHDECRFLHLTTICLENHVNSFCPDGRKLFKRLNFRDYFLSFVLPMDDDLFDDEDLDSCQIYDFVKDAEKREKEEIERKQEEERRRRIDDDEDYEEELTTIVNNMEDDSEDFFTSTMPTESTTSFETTSSESFSSSSSASVTPILGTLESMKQEEFTTILNDLITSSEQGTEKSNEENSEEKDHDDLDNLVNGFDEESPKEELNSEEKDTVTQLPTPSTSDPLIESKNEDNTEYHDYTDHHYDEEYHEDNENQTHPTISVVSIETRLSSSDSEEKSEENELIEVTTPDQILNLTPPNEIEKEDKEDEIRIETTTGKRKVFSEDSMENTPPNFFYSSNRYDSTTRSNYVADNLDLQDSEEPLEIDTSTLFGVEATSRESYDTSTEIIIPETTQIPKKKETKSKPWLHGGVIVKPILNFDQLDVDQDEEREREERRRLEQLKNSSSSLPTSPSESSPDDDDFLSGSDSPTTNETLIVIGLILLVACLILLILLLLLAYFCSTRTDQYNVHKDEGSPSV